MSKSSSVMYSMGSLQYEGDIYYETSARVESPVHLEEPEMQQNRPKMQKETD